MQALAASSLPSNFRATGHSGTKTGPRASSFWRVTRNKLDAIVVRIPSLRENYCVLRSLWTEFPAQTVRVHSLQESAHTILVSIHEPGHHSGGRALQHRAGPVLAPPARRKPSRKAFIPQLVLV